MRLSNFKMEKENDKVRLASIDVTTGSWIFNKVERKKIFKHHQESYWRFLDTGIFTPDYVVESLEKANEAHKLLDGQP